jgi:polar amino acid transport system permease protein
MSLSYRHLAITALIAFVAGLFIASFAGFKEFLPGLLRGSIMTIEITVVGCALAVVAAVVAAMGKMYGRGPVRWLAVSYIELFRGTSALVQLFWIFYVMPHFGINISAFTAAVIALGLNVGAYGAEVVRGAINAVPKGQWEAATALNLHPVTRMRRIIFPQAFVAMIPPWGNLFIELLKATALVSFISITELTFRAKQMNQTTFRTVEIFSLALVMYFIISLFITFFMRGVERRASRGLARGRGS